MASVNYPSATSSSKPIKSSGGNKGDNTKNILIGVLIAALLGSWGYVLWNKNNTGGGQEANTNMNSVQLSALDSIKNMYSIAEMRLDSLTGANNSLQGDKSNLQKEIEDKKAEINKILNNGNAGAAELSRAKILIAELNSQIQKLESEISQLRGENQQLAQQNTSLQTQKVQLTHNLETKDAENKSLTNTVEIAQTFSANSIAIIPINEKSNGKEVETATAKRVDKLQVSFNIENRVADSGPTDLYIIVSDPANSVVQNTELGSGAMVTREDGDRSFTAKVPVEYEKGTRRAVSFPIRNKAGFVKGNYKIEIYHNGFKIGEATKSLKKGGWFS